jgi:hypothetical protein
MKNITTKMQKEFGRVIMRYLKNEVPHLPKEQRSHTIMAVKDVVYFLGISISGEYEFAKGFNLYCSEIGIDWETGKETKNG